MLSKSYRSLFIHVPNTGGNPIQDALRSYTDDSIVCVHPHHDGVERFEVRSDTYATVKHSTLRDYQQAYGPELMATLYKFSTARNTWDRCMSHYFSPHRARVTWDKKDFIRFVETEVHPIGSYLAINPGIDSLQYSVDRLNFLIRYECLQEDFMRVCRQIGLPDLQLRFRNISTEKNYRRFYDEDTKELVANRFGEEIRQLGYRF